MKRGKIRLDSFSLPSGTIIVELSVRRYYQSVRTGQVTEWVLGTSKWTMGRTWAKKSVINPKAK